MNGPSHISPSLRDRAGRGAQAHEFKFVLPASKAARIEELAKQSLLMDPHCKATENRNSPKPDAYRVQSMYLDTPSLDVLNRTFHTPNTKYRIRRYGNSETVFLERKSKVRGELIKQRITTDIATLPEIDLAIAKPIHEIDDWFVQEIKNHQLKPVCVVQYFRQAFYSEQVSDVEPLRLTLDYQLCSKACRTKQFSDQAWHSAESSLELQMDPLGFIVGDQIILELKFAGSMPALFKKWMIELDITPRRFSKFRTTMQAYEGLALTGAA